MRNLLHALRSRTTRTLVTLLAGAMVLSGCSIYDVPLPGGPDTGSNPMKITVMFRDVLDLVPQSTVKVDDVTVGKVTAVKLKGYIAQVTIELPRNVDLPDNATAQIRQTSLLGEKFVSLAPPASPSQGRLGNGDTIGLDRTGRNPEVEEVFGALALLLNGGGVGQLKTIFSELNNALGGRENEVRSVLDQIKLFIGQLDQNKASVVAAIENTNRLAGELRKQDGTIKATLDDVPPALASVNRQRGDLVKLLQALTRLSGVGVRVIQASKVSTINSLRDLAPVLDGFAKAGQSFPKSFQVFLTYPFVDAAVGQDPQVARNLHMGDFTNLSVNLDLSLSDLTLPAGPTIPVPSQICAAVRQARAAAKKQIENTPGLTRAQKDAIEKTVLAQIEDTNCNISAATIQSYIAAAINALGAAVAAAVCPGAGPTVCNLLKNPTALPTLTAGAVPGGVSVPPLPIPRSQLGKGYQLPAQIDPFHLASHGLDPGIGTLLFQGVATQR